MKIRTVPSKFTILLPCVGIVAFGAFTAMADPAERTGADAPHQERNLAKNERKSALPLSSLNGPAFADTQKPVRKATAVKADNGTRKSRDKKKAEKQVKEKPKTEAVVADTVQEQPRYESQYTDRVGNDAPHQERGSDPNRRGARLLILER